MIVSKLVNNKLVTIKNIIMFEKAMEAITVGRIAVSNARVYRTLQEEELSKIDKYVTIYRDIYKSMPFPLYAIEEDIKYSVIGTLMKDRTEEAMDIWIENRDLIVQINKDSGIQFIGNTWAVVRLNDKKEDNTDIEIYRHDVGYREYLWILNKLMSGETTEEYYSKFMGDFLEACNNDPIILKWELERILELGIVPKKINLRENKIYCIEDNTEIFIDIYSVGRRKGKGKQLTINLDMNGNVETNIEKSTMPLYDFQAYEKKLPADDVDNDIGKVKKIELDGTVNLFESIVGQGYITGLVMETKYRGLIVDDLMIYQIHGSIFICNARNYGKTKMLADNSEIYSYDRGHVYIKRNTMCDSGAKKETIYAYNIKDKHIKMCRVRFYLNRQEHSHF